MDYKGFTICLDRHHWGYDAAAIPDHGETIRQRFIGYTKAEMISRMKHLINDYLGEKQ